jgi:hypothetical protein
LSLSSWRWDTVFVGSRPFSSVRLEWPWIQNHRSRWTRICGLVSDYLDFNATVLTHLVSTSSVSDFTSGLYGKTQAGLHEEIRKTLEQGIQVCECIAHLKQMVFLTIHSCFNSLVHTQHENKSSQNSFVKDSSQSRMSASPILERKPRCSL